MICKLISTFDEQINLTQRLGYTIVFKQIALPIGKAIKELCTINQDDFADRTQ